MSLKASVNRIKHNKTISLVVLCPSSQKPDHLLQNEKIHKIYTDLLFEFPNISKKIT